MAYKIVDTLVPGSANKFPVVDVVDISINKQYLNEYLDNLNTTITTLSATVDKLTQRVTDLEKENGTVTLDKERIENLISQADGLDDDDYTISSWESLDVAYKAAENARDNATTQDELDTAASALEQAIKNLIERITFEISGASYTAEPEMTWFAWANNESYNTSNNPKITCSSGTAFVYCGELRILSGTSYVSGNLLISSNGIYTIETQSTEIDKTDLETAIGEAEQIINSGKKADYTSGSWTNLENALEAAQTVFDKTSSTQEEVNNATQTLTNAINALVKTKDLANAISEVNKLDKTNYSDPSWAVLEEAKTQAEIVLANSTATQDQVDDAEDALNTAKANLLDISDLKAAIDRAQDYNETDYTSDSWEYLQTALGNAEAVLSSANVDLGTSQENVDAATDNLNNAYNKLVSVTKIEVVIEAPGQSATQSYSVYDGTTWETWYDDTKASTGYTLDSDNRIIPKDGWHLEDSSGNTIYANSDIIVAGTYSWKADDSQEEPTPTGIVDTIIDNKTPMYSISTTGELVETPFKLIDGDAAPTESGFYTITDDQGNIIEAGYQDLQVKNDSVYYVIALPKEIDYNTMVEVESWDPHDSVWVESSLTLTSDSEEVAKLCAEAGVDITHIDTDKYTVWVQENICTGSIIRYRIIEEN